MVNYKNMNIKDIKKLVFEQQFKRFPYLNNFKKNPYTYLKARYYMYSSVFLLYALLRSRITPNMITITYCLCGIIGGILLTLPNIYCNIAGVIIFFNKSILDWSDGYLARIKYKTTLTGHILDVYGASINSIGLTIGLGFFVINQTGYDFLIFLIAIVAFLYSELFTSFGKKVIFEDLNKIIKNNQNDSEKIIKDSDKKNALRINLTNYPKWIIYFKDFFDDRARSTDLILLIIIIDIYSNQTFSLYIFLIIFMRILFRFIFSFYFGVRTRWAEATIKNIDFN